MKQKSKQRKNYIKINEQIRSNEVYLIGVDNVNVGVISTKEAIERAKELGLDLVEISAKAIPPIAKIVDYGKWKYEQKKKQKGSAKSAKKKGGEVKSLQIKIVTGQDAVKRRIQNIEEWLGDGYQIKIDLFLFGRYKFMDEAFLKNRLQEFINLISHPYTVVEEMRRSPKGFSILIQAGKKVTKEVNQEKNDKDQ